MQKKIIIRTAIRHVNNRLNWLEVLVVMYIHLQTWLFIGIESFQRSLCPPRWFLVTWLVSSSSTQSETTTSLMFSLFLSSWTKKWTYYLRKDINNISFVMSIKPALICGMVCNISPTSNVQAMICRTICTRILSKPAQSVLYQPLCVSTGCSGKIVFFHNSLQPLPRLHCCKRPSKQLSTQCECTVSPIGW